MLANYLKIAWRNLFKNKKSSFINITGLAAGMAVFIMIALWVRDELSFDRYHQNYDRIGQAWQTQIINGEVFADVSVPFLIGDELATSYASDFNYIVMSSWQGENILSSGEKHLSVEGIFMDTDAPRMLSLAIVEGSMDGLNDKNSVMLSQSAARAFFGTKSPINERMTINRQLDVKVTAVYEDLPFNTSFQGLKFIAPWELYISAEPWIERTKSQWNNNSFQLFAQINDSADFATVNQHIRDAKLKRIPDEDRKYNPQIILHPMKDWHLRSDWKNGQVTGGRIGYVRLFSMIGVFVLFLACINFMNLSTARSERRAKEVGIRKTIGSSQSSLVLQFLLEAILTAGIALLLSLIIVQLTLPWFNEVAGKKISIPWTSPWFGWTILGFTLLTGVIAGGYPAFFLSAFNPLAVLKGTPGRYTGLPRKVLVVMQFTISTVLIIGTLTVYRQIQHTKNRPVGYDRTGLMMVEMKTADFYGKFDVLRTRLKQQGLISELSESSSPLTAVWSNTSGLDWEGKDPNLSTDFANIRVTHEFGETVGWQLKEGRDFSRELASDSASLIINEAAVKFMGLQDPVNMPVTWMGQNFRIIGVVEDMIMNSPFEPVKQTFYQIDYENVNWINLKLHPGKGIQESIRQIEAVFREVIPGIPFEYKFTDTEYAAKFIQEEQIGTLATFFAILAVFISCLGVFGLAAFVAEQRTKEIGIRKITGASLFQLWQLLSGDFILLVLISCLIAIPLSYYGLSQWLQQYHYRSEIPWWLFALTTAGALLITLMTVSFQTLRAALANPVKSLRNE